jgi:GxxExxY protein
MPEYEKSDTTEKIIKAAFNVHGELGPHFMEVVYQRALEIELKKYFSEFEREVKLPIYYKGIQIDTRRADFFIDEVVVEIKAKEAFEPKDFEQLLAYLKASNLRIGLLINFGAKKIEIRRLING